MGDEHDRSGTVIGVIVTLTPITTLFVVARVYGCRYLLRRRLYFEEWLCLVALVRIYTCSSSETQILCTHTLR